MRKAALMLTATEDLWVLRGLGRLGLRVFVAAGEPCRALRLSRHCSGYARVAASEKELAQAPDPVVDAVAGFARRCGAEFVVPADVQASLCAARLKGRLPGAGFFPTADPDTLRLMDNKLSFYRFLVEQGLPSPRTWLIERPAQARELPLPLVLKPMAGSGGEGVEVVREAGAREARLSRASELPLLAQEFVPGDDVDLSFLAAQGRLLAWTVQTRRPDGSIDFIEDERVVELGRRIARASSYTGLAHLDMRYDGPSRSAIRVIECNPRFWGSLFFTLGLGVDFMRLGLEMAAGRVPPPMEGPRTGYAPGLIWAFRRLLTGRIDLPPSTRLYMRYRLGDPLPEIYGKFYKLLRKLRKRFPIGHP